MSKRKNETPLDVADQPQPGDIVPVTAAVAAEAIAAYNVPVSGEYNNIPPFPAFQQDDLRALYAALFAVQGEVEGIVRGNDNPFFSKGDRKATYADRTTVLETVRPLFQKHGLVLLQPPVAPDSGFITETAPALHLKTIIIHAASGQKVEHTAVVPLPKNDPQGYASAITYASRISLVAFLALPLLEDDDGNAASGPAPKRATPSSATSKGTATSPASGTQREASAGTAVEPEKTTTTPSASPSKGRKLWGNS